MRRKQSGYVIYWKAKEVCIDESWTPVLKQWKDEQLRQKKGRSMEDKLKLTILKANALGAAGFKVTNVAFSNEDFQLETDLFSQKEIDAYSLRRKQMLSDHNNGLWNEIVKARAKNGLLTATPEEDIENLSDEQIEALILKYQSESLS
jgi:hypothetical protein